MPTIKDVDGSYRFFFYSFDCNEPMHVHVQKDNMTCKFWVNPVSLCKSHGFSPKELNTVLKIIRANENRIMEAWDEHCCS